MLARKACFPLPSLLPKSDFPSLLLCPFLSTDQGYLPKDAKAMEILRLEGIEVWNESGTRTLDDQSALQASIRSWGLECTQAAQHA